MQEFLLYLYLFTEFLPIYPILQQGLMELPTFYYVAEELIQRIQGCCLDL